LWVFLTQEKKQKKDAGRFTVKSPPKGPTRGSGEPSKGSNQIDVTNYKCAKHRQRGQPRRKNMRPDTKDARCKEGHEYA
jgi:hypothetical protein